MRVILLSLTKQKIYNQKCIVYYKLLEQPVNMKMVLDTNNTTVLRNVTCNVNQNIISKTNNKKVKTNLKRKVENEILYKIKTITTIITLYHSRTTFKMKET